MDIKLSIVALKCDRVFACQIAIKKRENKKRASHDVRGQRVANQSANDKICPGKKQMRHKWNEKKGRKRTGREKKGGF